MTTAHNGYRAANGRFAPKPLRWWQKLAVKLFLRVAK
jgi:hypothetical protein